MTVPAFYCRVCRAQSHINGTECVARPFHEWPLTSLPAVRTDDGFAVECIPRIHCKDHPKVWLEIETSVAA